jgi:hypothetical protein
MRPVAASLAVIAVLLSAGGAAAQGDIVVPTETQFNLYQEGAEAYAAGEYSKAVDLFRASLRLGELNITYLNLGRALFKLGDCQEASAAYGKALTAPKIANPTPMQVLGKVEEYKKDLGECPAVVTVECDDAEAELWVDGTGPVPCDGAAMMLLPGEHELEARLAGEVRAEKISVASMESKTVPMRFHPVVPVGPTGPTPPVVQVPEEPTRVRVGAAVALVATGSADVEVGGGDDAFMETGKDDSQVGVNLFLGYRLVGGLVVGAGLWYFPTYKLVDDEDAETVGDATALDANVMLMYEHELGAFVPFVVVEGGYTSVDDGNNDTTHTGFNVGAGAGGRFYLAPNFALGLDVRATHYDVGSDVDLARDFNFTGNETDLDLSDFQDTTIEYSVIGTRILVNVGATLAF